MKQIPTTLFSIVLCGAVVAAANHGDNGSDASENGGSKVMANGRADLSFARAPHIFGQTNSFIETYDDGTDVGLWHCSVGVPRLIESSGGNPGMYLQQGGFSSAIPTWASISTRFQPGVNDPYKIDSIYTGDWTSLGVTRIAADLNVIQVATWTTDRAATLELLQMDETGFNVNYDATYTLPDL